MLHNRNLKPFGVCLLYYSIRHSLFVFLSRAKNVASSYSHSYFTYCKRTHKKLNDNPSGFKKTKTKQKKISAQIRLLLNINCFMSAQKAIAVYNNVNNKENQQLHLTEKV